MSPRTGGRGEKETRSHGRRAKKKKKASLGKNRRVTERKREREMTKKKRETSFLVAFEAFLEQFWNPRGSFKEERPADGTS